MVLAMAKLPVNNAALPALTWIMNSRRRVIKISDKSYPEGRNKSLVFLLSLKVL
jgi:hypothetical protein